MFTDLLTDVCKIERITRANVDGEAKATLEVVARDVPCLIQEGTGEVRMSGGAQALQYDGTGWFDAGTDLRPRDRKGGDQDRVTITRSDRLTVGTIYTVVIANPSPGVESHVEAKLMRLASSTGA